MKPSILAGSVFAAFLLLLSGCDRSTAAPETRSSVVGGAVSFRLADTMVHALSSEADSVRLVLRRSGWPDRMVSAPLGGWIRVDSLPAGSWTFEVALYRIDGSLSWYGTSTVQVEGGRTVDATVHLGRATGNVNVRVVLDSIWPCTLSAVPRLDTVHPTSVPLSSYRRIRSVTSRPDGILIEVGAGWYAVPHVAATREEEGISLQVGDPFFECGGITGPCNVSMDTNFVQQVFVPFADFPGCSGQVSVTGSPSLAPISYFRCGFGGKPTISAFVWRSEGGWTGAGTGESITLEWSGFLRRVLRDSLGRLDSVEGAVAPAMLAYADSILRLPEVISLPSSIDTVGSVVSDGIGDQYRLEGLSTTLLDLHQPARYCFAAPVERNPADTGIRLAQPTTCPSSNGLLDLQRLVTALRSAPILQPR